MTLDLKVKVKNIRYSVLQWEGSGPVIECLTRDQGAAGSNLTGVCVVS